MNILVTGGMGFVGSHLIEEIVKEKHKITIVTKSMKKKRNILSIKNKIKIEYGSTVNYFIT